nr:hypothetical protein [Snodgrassella alvi]
MSLWRNDANAFLLFVFIGLGVLGHNPKITLTAVMIWWMGLFCSRN